MKKYFLLMCLFLSACFFSTPDSRFYLLENPQAKQTISAKKINIAVQDISVPAYLDRPQIVLQSPDNPELKIAEFDRWASDLNTMLQTFVINGLQNALPNAVVKPLVYGGRPQYVVKINIEKFSGWLKQTAYISGSWQILNNRGKILYEQSISAEKPCGKTYAEYVKAQSLMLNEITNSIAKKIVFL